MKKHALAVLAAVCLLAAAVFKFALIGYSVLAMCFLGLAVVLGFYQLAVLRRLKKAGIAVAVLLLAGVIVFAVFEIPVISAAGGDAEPEASFLIVLGAGVNGSTPSLSMVNRLTAVKAYMEQYPNSIAILSGGQGSGEDITEAQAMFTWLTARGVAPERLLLEDRATSTEENIAFSLDIIAERGGSTTDDVAICSSEYHLCRAKYLAAKQGCAAFTVPARTSYPFLRINYFIREAFGMAYYRLLG